MKKVIILLSIFAFLVSCQPCDGVCEFKEGDEVTIKAKIIVNNSGVISEVNRHMDCSCYYSVQHANMLNFTTTLPYEEYELKR